ncbi:MAG TPA: tyrosine-type recombinase/integrase [Actinospica sp.]|nr:tyrosine-type recombinase/integrase [Actinospica sp.]
MGYVRCRQNKLRKHRYTAVFWDVRGIERSAGTFGRRVLAERAWKSAEASVADGRYLDLDQGRKRFADYALGTWLPQFAGEDTTVQGYGFVLGKYLIPEFGQTRMIEVTPGRVRAFYALMRDAGIGASMIEKCKTVLCSLFNTAVNDRVVGRHPCRGVESPTVVQAPLKILTPAEYVRLHAYLRDDYARLMVDVLLESGCRWGEFAELRVGDLDLVAGTLTVARTVVEVDSKYVPAGECGFRVKQYPKNRCWRKVAISPELVGRLTGLVSGRRRDALLFPAVGRQTGRRAGLGVMATEPESFTVAGRRFTHGTLYAYTKGSCRCEPCREAVAAYRAARRGQGQDRPPKQQVADEVRQMRHMRRDWFRNRVFHPAIEAAGLDWRPRVHDLRHASASWALAGGATVQQVREHLGHVSLRAVERYLHNLPGAEAGAAGAIARVRATGTLYPLVTPSYTPMPLVSGPAAAAAPLLPPEQEAEAPSHVPQPLELASVVAAAVVVPQHDSAGTGAGSGSSHVPSPVVPAAETATVRSESSADASFTAARHYDEPEVRHSEIVTMDIAGEELAAREEEPGLNPERLAAQKRPTAPRGRGSGRSRHRPNSKRRGGKPRNDHFRVQDRYSDDEQETNGRTPLPEPGSVPAESLATDRERYLEHLRLKSQATMSASGDKSTSAAQPLRSVAARPNSGREAKQTSSVPEKCSERSDPLANHEQRIKKPVPSASGDRLSPA